MAQVSQIVPKFSFPYVETVINDYTEVSSDDVLSTGVAEPVVRYIFPFVSSKGIDNKFIKYFGRSNIVKAYGESNYKKYGQPLMQALNVATSPNVEVWCMRVMPENAEYARSVVSVYYKADDSNVKASERKFRIKFVQKSDITTPIIEAADLQNVRSELDGTTTNKVFVDSEGYTQIPGIFTFRCAGRGSYGNNYRVRIGQDIYYEKEYGIKFYDFEVLNSEKGLVKENDYIGSMVTSNKYDATTFINDILDDSTVGTASVFINVDEDGIEDVYSAYAEWLTELYTDLQEELNDVLDSTSLTTEMIEGTETVSDDDKEEVLAIRELIKKVDAASTVPDLDQFDIIFGKSVASTSDSLFITYPKKLTDDVDITADDFNADDYTNIDDQNIVFFDSVDGVRLFDGNNGYFDAPRVTNEIDEVTGNTIIKQWTIDEEIEECYKNAFSGVYDRRILTPKRIKANALWDANYPMSVKNAMADLAILRNDGLCYLDTGIIGNLSTKTLTQLINDYSVFNDSKISKNIHHYFTKEPTSRKRVPVTISYYLSRKFAEHVINFGAHVPFVKGKAQLDDHIKDTLYPTVEDFESDLKETLCENRFNFFETIDDNVYQRATQNTAQTSTSDLLEENNVHTLYEMKRIIERDISDELYDFTDSETRQRFREYEKAKFQSWSNKEVQSFDIEFKMNSWEAERSILHAYINVTFRGLQKRAILEIDVNKRTYEETSNNEDSFSYYFTY